MKIFVVFLVLFLSFSNGSDFIPNDTTNGTSTVTPTVTTPTPSPSSSSSTATITTTTIATSTTTTSVTTTTTTTSTATTNGTTILPPITDISVNVTWTYSNATNVTSFTMTVKNLKASEWAAIGFGQQQLMGEAHVFICKRLVNDTVILNRYINPKGHDDSKPAGSEQGGVLTLGPQSLINDIVTCHFNLLNFTTRMSYQANGLNPLSQSKSYYPIFAIGKLDSTGRPQQHASATRAAKSALVQLNENTAVSYEASDPNGDDSLKYFQAHGIIMVFAWILFAPTGILISRYFKRTWANQIVCGEASWFSAHRFILSIATILTLLGFQFILVAEEGTWVGSGDEIKHFIHSITGIIVISLAIFQLFLALFRCKPISSYRKQFNYIHRTFGISALILSIITIFLATYFLLFKNNGGRIIMILWILWIVLVVVTLEIIERRWQANPIASHDSNINVSDKSVDELVERDEHESNVGDKIKNILLVVHIIIALTFSIALSALIGQL